MTHTQRWHAHRHSAGRGHLYQSRFKSFPIQQDGHFLSVCRYVERNALRAGLAETAEQWRWGSMGVRGKKEGPLKALLSAWPVARPRRWSKLVNSPQEEKELAALHCCRQRGRPYGEAAWVVSTARRLGLESSLRDVGRPKKAEKAD
jgi:putative transposase